MPLPEADPDVFETKSGGGCLSLFGLPFLLIGVGALFAAISGALGGSEELPPLLFGLPMGLVFAAVGGLMVFGRAGLRIDRKSGEIVKWWGLLKPMRSTRHALAELDAVGLFREIRRSKNSTYTVFPVRLLLASGARVDVSAGQIRKKARAEAEALAKFARKPLEDHSEGEPVRREHDELDLSLRDRHRKGSLPGDIPEVPKALSSKIDYDGERLAIEIPPAGFRPLRALAVLILLAFSGFAALVMLGAAIDGGGTSGFGRIALAAFAGLFALIPAALAAGTIASMFWMRERVIATSEGLERSRGWPRPREKRVAAAEIEDVRLANARQQARPGAAPSAAGWAVVLETDDDTIRIGGRLRREEAEYLMALIRATLVS